MNSCKRQKVAKNLRDANKRFSGWEPWLVEDLMQALGFESYEDGDENLFIRLAELIECHTCEMEEGRMKLCVFTPDLPHSWVDDNDEEHQTSCAAYGYDHCICSNCGEPMLDEWFYEEQGEHGGLKLTPRFRYCPYCGAAVVPL